MKEQDKSSDIEQQPPFGDRKISNIQPQNRGGGGQNQQEHHIILTKYEAVHPKIQIATFVVKVSLQLTVSDQIWYIWSR